MVNIKNTVINIGDDMQRPMSTFHVTITSSSNKSEKLFPKTSSGAYYLTKFLQPGHNYTVSVKGEVGGLLTTNACTGNISIGTSTQKYHRLT